MTRNLHTALGVVATLGLALAASAAIAHSPGMGGGAQGGMGEHGATPGSMHGGMGASMHAMHAAMHGGMHAGSAGSTASGGAGEELMTPQEHDAMHEKMASAKTPQERQALASGMRAEMEKRAKERGIAMPEHGAGQGGMGMQQGSGGEHRH